MKLDQGTFNAIIKESRKGEDGFNGKSAADFRNWAEAPERNISEFVVNGKSYTIDDIAGAWTTKTVVISFDPAEDDVIIEEAAGEEVAEMDEDEAEGKMEDEDEVEAKSLRKEIRSKRGNSSMVKKARSISGMAGKSMSGSDFKKKAYDHAVKSGGKFAGQRPVIADADRVELLGAYARRNALGYRDYEGKSFDEKILGKAGSTLVNSTGGALVFGEFFPELIENINENGAFRKAAGVTPMREGRRTVSRISADPTVYKVDEGASIEASDPTLNNVVLSAEKIAALVVESNEVVNDSAFDIGSILSRAIPRAIGTFEDQSAFLGSNGYEGVTDKIGSNTTYDAALSAAWSEFTVSDIQDTLAQLPGWAYSDPNMAIVCSSAFYQSVLRRFSLSSGGVTGQELASGSAPSYVYDGIPVHISEVMPKTYAGNAVVMLAGAWGHSTKCGVVNGSEQMASSPDLYFDKDQIAFRYTQRWAFSLHDVNDTANASGIVGLQD